MDNLRVRDLAERLPDLLGAEPPDATCLARGIIREPAGEFVTIGIADGHDVPLLKFAANLDDADGQQAFLARLQREPGATIDHEMPLGPCRQPDPALPCPLGLSLRQ